jgi:O-antigen/teichoic acid export membrane protein
MILTNMNASEAISLPSVPETVPAPVGRDYFSVAGLRSDLRSRALTGATITLVAQACGFALSTVGTIVLARLLTPHDFGLVAMVLAFSFLLQNFGLNGFVEAIIQREHIDHRQVSTLWWINAALNLALALLFVALGPAIAQFYGEPLLTPIVAAMALSILFGGLSTQHQALLRRNMEFGKVAACEVGGTLGSLGIAIVLAYRGWGYWALVARWVSNPLATTMAAWALCGWRPGLPARRTGVGPMLRFAFHTYGNFALFYFCRTADKILVGRFHGSPALGAYDRAYQLSMMLPNQLLSPLNSVVMPAFSRLADDPDRYRETYLSALSVLAFVCLPLSAALTLTGSDLILTLLGPQWESAGRIFAVFGLSIGVLMLYCTHSWLHLSLGTPDRWLRWAVVALVVTGLLFVAGLPYGPFGVAVGYSASFYLLTLPALSYAGRPIDLKVADVVRRVGKYFVAAFAAAIVTWSMTNGFAPTAAIFARADALVRIAASSALCLSAYLMFVVMLYRSVAPITRFVRIVREMIPIVSSSKVAPTPTRV